MITLNGRVQKRLRCLAVLGFACTLTIWLATGANRGWTKTAEPVKTVDEVTGIEGISYQARFAPGLDFLGAGLIGAAVLGIVSQLIRNVEN